MLRDEDRIFTNIYGFHGADLVAASRGATGTIQLTLSKKAVTG